MLKLLHLSVGHFPPPVQFPLVDPRTFPGTFPLLPGVGRFPPILMIVHQKIEIQNADVIDDQMLFKLYTFELSNHKNGTLMFCLMNY